jgi:hypothetical protein
MLGGRPGRRCHGGQRITDQAGDCGGEENGDEDPRTPSLRLGCGLVLILGWLRPIHRCRRSFCRPFEAGCRRLDVPGRLLGNRPHIPEELSVGCAHVQHGRAPLLAAGGEDGLACGVRRGVDGKSVRQCLVEVAREDDGGLVGDLELHRQYRQHALPDQGLRRARERIGALGSSPLARVEHHELQAALVVEQRGQISSGLEPAHARLVLQHEDAVAGLVVDTSVPDVVQHVKAPAAHRAPQLVEGGHLEALDLHPTARHQAGHGGLHIGPFPFRRRLADSRSGWTRRRAFAAARSPEPAALTPPVRCSAPRACARTDNGTDRWHGRRGTPTAHPPAGCSATATGYVAPCSAHRPGPGCDEGRRRRRPGRPPRTRCHRTRESPPAAGSRRCVRGAGHDRYGGGNARDQDH